MESKGEPKGPSVRRVTVDSIWDEKFKSLEVCELKRGLAEFTDDVGAGVNDTGIAVNHKDYLTKLRIPPGMEGRLPWDDLVEGRVFLMGNFRRVAEDAGEARFRVDIGTFDILRIDGMIRGKLERMYVSAISRRT